jgi:ketopantoate reductase
MPTRVLLVGAGAIGAFFGSRLATVPQVLVSALCRSNYKAVRDNGFKVTSPQYGIYAFKPEYTFANPEEARQVKKEKSLTWDFLLVATKALPDVSDDSLLLDGLVGDETSIVLVQNGLGIEEPYRKRFPSTTLLSAVTIASCVQPKAGVIDHNKCKNAFNMILKVLSVVWAFVSDPIGCNVFGRIKWKEFNEASTIAQRLLLFLSLEGSRMLSDPLAD